MPLDTENKINKGSIGGNRRIILLEFNVWIDLHLRGKHCRNVVAMKDMVVFASACDPFDLLEIVLESGLAHLEDCLQILGGRLGCKAVDCLQSLHNHLVAAGLDSEAKDALNCVGF